MINAKLADGSLATLEVTDHAISKVEPQDGLVSLTEGLGRPLSEFSCAQSHTPGAVWDAEGKLLIPAMVDMHIHSRDPGFPEKETWQTLAAGAYAGGVVAVADMPNTSPPTLDEVTANHKLELAAVTGIEAKVYLGVGASNAGRLKHILSVAGSGVCGIKIYYGHSTGNMMFSDLEQLHRVLPTDRPLLLSFHSEDQCRIDGNYQGVSDADLSRTDHAAFRLHSKIRDSEAARKSTELILNWALKYGRSVHIAHVSTPAEIELIQQFKHKGASITSEVAPHHLLLCEDDYEQLGPFLKVNPPVRSRQEVEQLKRHLANGEIDAIATDHAPHTIAEKRASLKSAPSGLPSIEFYVPLLFKIGRMLGIPVPRLVDLGSRTPARLLGLDHIGRIAPGYDASFVLLGEGAWIAEESRVKSKCGWSPYAGFEFPVWVEGTWHRGVRKFARNQSIIPAC